MERSEPPLTRVEPTRKYHVGCDANGLPLHALLSAANSHDSKLLEPLLETNPAMRGRRGRPGRPRAAPAREQMRIARHGIEDKSKLGRVRLVSEPMAPGLKEPPYLNAPPAARSRIGGHGRGSQDEPRGVPHRMPGINNALGINKCTGCGPRCHRRCGNRPGRHLRRRSRVG
ncbi:transposase [Pseudonocardia sp. KRD-291]|nr:transposase [Pseudonocardia sp. KRD291]